MDPEEFLLASLTGSLFFLFCPGASEITQRSFSFHFNFTSFRGATLQHSWFSRGPALNGEIYIQAEKQPYNIKEKIGKVANILKKKD